jgi:catechol 2,3-dioxygenase-like lactoylglutathione lyase family enzyme
MAARIRYLAIVSPDPEALAGWYRQYLGLRELGRSDAGVSLTDGFYNLSILRPSAGDDEPGLQRFGLEIDDIREVEARLEEYAPCADIAADAGGLHHGEYRVLDPNGISLSLSERAFNVPGEDRQLPNIRHVALSVPNNDDVLAFYQQVFGFEPVSQNEAFVKRVPPITARFAADGATNLAILPEPKLLDEPPDGHRKFGLNHFGFLVPGMEAMLAALPAGSASKRPSNRPFAEYRVVDPEGNNFDISSEHGFEIAYGVWAKPTP